MEKVFSAPDKPLSGLDKVISLPAKTAGFAQKGLLL